MCPKRGRCLPGGPAVKAPCSQCRWHGFGPWSGNLGSACCTAWPNKQIKAFAKWPSVTLPMACHLGLYAGVSSQGTLQTWWRFSPELKKGWILEEGRPSTWRVPSPRTELALPLRQPHPQGATPGTMDGKVTVLYIGEPFNTIVWHRDRVRDVHLLTLEITETRRGQTNSPVSYTWHGWARIWNLIDCQSLPTQGQGEVVSVISWGRWRRDWGSLVNNICLHWGKTSCTIKPLHQTIGITPH